MNPTDSPDAEIPTPLTDAIRYNERFTVTEMRFRLERECESLERFLTATQAELAKAKEETESVRFCGNDLTRKFIAELDSLKAELAELKKINMADYTEAGWNRATEVEADLARVTKERERFIAPLREVIPHTYGDAVIAGVDLGDLPCHDWDNKTTEEQAAWLIGHLRSTIDATKKERDLAMAAYEEMSSARDTAQSKLHAIASLVEGYVDGAPDRNASATLANAVMQIIGSTKLPKGGDEECAYQNTTSIAEDVDAKADSTSRPAPSLCASNAALNTSDPSQLAATTKPAALLEAEAKVAELVAAIEQDLACHMHQHGPCSCSCERALRRALSSSPSGSELLKDEPKPHNPDNLTPEQVGVSDGWRLLDEDEIKEAPERTIPETSVWWGNGHWGCVCPHWPCQNIRTKLTRAELRKARGLDAAITAGRKET